MNQFKFNLGETARITSSDEQGTVIGRAEYQHCDNSYLLRYRSGDGRAVETWWSESALAAA